MNLEETWWTERKEIYKLLQRKRRRQTENRSCTLCANVPKIYPKWQNGTAQMAKWDSPNGGLGYEKRGFRASEQGCRGGVLGCRGQRNGVHRPRYAPKIGWNRRKGQSFLQFSGHGKWHHNQVENMENHTQTPLSCHCIEYWFPIYCNYPSLHFHNDFHATTEPLCHALRICICNLQLQKMSFCHAVVSEKGVI